ncbi:hypothetical protein BK704_01250 [[Bacillus thuringiensis] serovar konkukian]|nr:helix-turn-helix transcriptional regulator [Bacillus thuringiensis]MED1304181.1 helix-turn-helix transcriptional regulator [Bacillus pacificus]OUB18351.1 hypothetical protein BK704_01250 [[Bacillus thuringiensis] serovar konkukian]
MTFGQRLKELRGSRTQDEVAQKLGIARARYSHFENNRHEPDLQLIQKMANYYEVTTDYLLGNSNHKTLDEEKSEKISKEAADLMERINKLPSQKRNAILNLIDNY